MTTPTREMSKSDSGRPLTFRFSIEPAEHARAIAAASRLSRWRFLAFGLMLIPLLPLLAFGLADDVRWIHPRVLLPVLILVALPYLLFGPWAQRFRIRRALRRSPILQSEHIYGFSDAGLTSQSGATAASFAWKDMRRVEESAEFLLFFTSARRAHYLPKRLIVDDVQDHELRALILAHAHGAGVHPAQRIG